MGSGKLDGTLNHTSSGWSLDGSFASDVGMMLGDIYHDGHPFAVSMTLERVATLSLHKYGVVDVETFKLGSLTPTFGPKWYDRSAGAKDPLGYYDIAFVCETDYELTGLHSEKNQKLYLEHIVAFSDYNKNPSHEPGNLLRAARCYPMLKVRSPAITKDKPLDYGSRITAIQAIFRIAPFIYDGNTYLNQAGTFTDLDNAGTLAGLVIGATGKVGAYAFTRAEKPLHYEIASRGIDEGYPDVWDNIHQWANDQTYKNLPATPGMPYGAHQHWRWATTATTGAKAGFTTTIKGQPQFGGAAGAGMPLIDSRFPDTTLDFAVVRREDEQLDDGVLNLLDTNPKHYYFNPFHQLFEDVRSKPYAIAKGDQLVQWVSVIVHTPDRHNEEPSYLKATKGSDPVLPAIEGTLNVHGYFFSHEDNSVLPFFLPPGSTKPQYLPGAPKRVWKR